MATKFGDFVSRLEEEARAEGPEAMGQLNLQRRPHVDPPRAGLVIHVAA
jgi:hypothetical protein